MRKKKQHSFDTLGALYFFIWNKQEPFGSVEYIIQGDVFAWQDGPTLFRRENLAILTHFKSWSVFGGVR